jgi:undecaprenyl pyrophosphate synthase
VLNLEQICSSLGIEMVDLYSLTAATTARQEAEARTARKAYEKWKTRAAQVAALLVDSVQAATNAAAAAPRPMASATPPRQTAEAAPGERVEHSI